MVQNRLRYFLRRIAWAAPGLLTAAMARGQNGVVLHEYIPPDAAEDLALGVLTPSGKMPAAMRTSSGVVSAPNTLRPEGDALGPSDRASSAGRVPTYGSDYASTSERFRIDGTTSDPGLLHYHEPFRPSIAPFKRMVVLDAVNDAFELVLRDSTQHRVELHDSPQAGDDEFYADLTLSGGQPLRIPSVSSGMRVLAADLEPDVPFQLRVDTADNWFFQAQNLIGKGRLILRIAAPRAALSPDVVANSYSTLTTALPEVPAIVSRAAEPVLQRIGVSRVFSPTDAVRTLVEYFRSFRPSHQHIDESAGRELYQQLALSRKGVCRHRAYAFVVTALALGIPARFVHNEAHAWVEVFDGKLWHRIDLGGAAPGLTFDGEKPEGPAYRMPSDNYEWPRESSPGDQLSLKSTGSQLATPMTASDPNLIAKSISTASHVSIQTDPGNHSQSNEPEIAEPAPQESAPDSRPLPKLSFHLVGDSTVHRGDAMRIAGVVESETGFCGMTRIDFTLLRQGERQLLGSTATDDRGRFQVQVTLPLSAGIGPYELAATTGESAACRASGATR